jgi:hypothetical protein
LAADRPDVFLPDLANALNSQSNVLADLGRREEALAAIEEAVQILGEPAADRPDVCLPDLAMALNSQSNRLAERGGGKRRWSRSRRRCRSWVSWPRTGRTRSYLTSPAG